ncbi:hypothetical protein ES708_34249 [subsurface metagenome]
MENVPWFNFVYGALTGNDCELDQSVKHLREWTLDCVEHNYRNSHRVVFPSISTITQPLSIIYEAMCARCSFAISFSLPSATKSRAGKQFGAKPYDGPERPDIFGVDSRLNYHLNK